MEKDPEESAAPPVESLAQVQEIPIADENAEPFQDGEKVSFNDIRETFDRFKPLKN